jgi:hypothetical protein
MSRKNGDLHFLWIGSAFTLEVAFEILTRQGMLSEPRLNLKNLGLKKSTT